MMPSTELHNYTGRLPVVRGDNPRQTPSYLSTVSMMRMPLRAGLKKNMTAKLDWRSFASKIGHRTWTQSVQGAVATWSNDGSQVGNIAC